VNFLPLLLILIGQLYRTPRKKSATRIIHCFLACASKIERFNQARF